MYSRMIEVKIVIKTEIIHKDIDIEWMELILEAKNIGMTTEEVREYLIQNGNNKKD